MRKLLIPLILGASVAIGAGAASAQSVNVQVDVDRPSHRTERPPWRNFDRPTRVERPGMWDRDRQATGSVRVVQYHRARPGADRRFVERRYVMPRRVRTVCRTVIRERIRPNGAIVRRPVEVCRRVVVRR
jgi:hypothetical protein